MYKRASNFEKWGSFLGKGEPKKKSKSSQDKNSLKYKLYERMKHKELINKHWKDLRIEGVYLGKIIKEIKSISSDGKNIKKKITNYVCDETGKTLKELESFLRAIFKLLTMEETINKMSEDIEKSKKNFKKKKSL